MNDFKDKVVYQIYPKSFMDLNGDGFGDLKGVTAKLDYLADLGVDYLWLTPFFPSPQRDNGYDVADYRAIDPRYGTMEDLEELICEADRRGIGLMLDMVFNHTSTEHEWFKKALAGDKKYQDYYIFKDGTPDCYPTNWVSKFGGPAQENAGHPCGKNRVLVPRQRGFVSLSPVRWRDGAAGSLQPAGAGNCQAPARRLDRCRETAG